MVSWMLWMCVCGLMVACEKVQALWARSAMRLSEGMTSDIPYGHSPFSLSTFKAQSSKLAYVFSSKHDNRGFEDLSFGTAQWFEIVTAFEKKPWQDRSVWIWFTVMYVVHAQASMIWDRVLLYLYYFVENQKSGVSVHASQKCIEVQSSKFYSHRSECCWQRIACIESTNCLLQGHLHDLSRRTPCAQQSRDNSWCTWNCFAGRPDLHNALR